MNPLLKLISRDLGDRFIKLGYHLDATDKVMTQELVNELMPLFNNGTANDETVEPIISKFEQKAGM